MASTEIPIMTNGTKLFFTWLDYTLFVLMLGISTMTGIYFGFWGRKEDTPMEYLYGGKRMGTLPIALSLLVSLVSAITMVGTPTEMYLYGTLYWLICISAPVGAIISYYVYLPVFYELQCISAYEYFELRFNRSVRILASAVSTLTLLVINPAVLYISALTFSQVSGINIHYIAPMVVILCLVYTALGGMRAVVWADVLQGVIMVTSCVVIIIIGVIHVGGVSTVWQRNQDGGRIRIFEMDLSPFKRMSFLSVVIGYPIQWVGHSTINQAMIQRYLSLQTYSKARTALILYNAGTIIFVTITCITGLVIYATYYNCDPIKSEIISRPDQLMAYYVMDLAQSIGLQGLPGLFTAAIFSASLSTLSSNLNGLGATVLEDFVRPCLRKNLTDKSSNILMKWITVLFGALCLILVFAFDKLGTIIPLVFSFSGVTVGTVMGMFSFGMFYPRGNSKGVLTGGICSVLIMGWIAVGNKMARVDMQEQLSTSIDECGLNNTSLDNHFKVRTADEVFPLYRISFMYYMWMAVIIVFVVGVIVSLLTELPDAEKNNPTLFAPFVRKYIIQRQKRRNKNDPVEMQPLSVPS